jgi:3-oxoacyl-[acyl-carrier protein] reductase
VTGETVMITESSSGIGRTIVERFATDRADVVITSRSHENVAWPQSAPTMATSSHALAVECDITHSLSL